MWPLYKVGNCQICVVFMWLFSLFMMNPIMKCHTSAKLVVLTMIFDMTEWNLWIICLKNYVCIYIWFFEAINWCVIPWMARNTQSTTSQLGFYLQAFETTLQFFGVHSVNYSTGISPTSVIWGYWKAPFAWKNFYYKGCLPSPLPRTFNL